MKRTMRSAVVLGVAGSIWLLAAAGGVGVSAQGSGEQAAATSADGDWPMYRRDPAGTGFSPLDGITADNVADLASAWTYSLAAVDEGARGPNSQVTPIVVGGVMYLPAADRVVALEASTGREIWRHPLAGARPSRRGVSWWAGGDGMAPRILFTTGQHLHALDAATGVPVESFGEGGVADMVVPYNSVPLVHGDVVVVGANTPAGTIGGIGNARAFDARTGAPVWEFSSVAQPGEPGHDTWEGDSWRGRLGANAWPFLFLDGRRARAGVPAPRVPDSRRLRRRPARRQPVRQRPRRRGHRHRGVPVALPDDSSRPVGRRPPGAARPVRHSAGRRGDSRPRGDHQVGLSLHSRPGNRRSRLRGRGTPGGGQRRPRRGHLAHPADTRQAGRPVQAHLQPGRPGDRRGHLARARRGVPAARRQSGRDLQRRSLHPVGLSPRGRPAADHPLVPRRGRRRQLGRRGGGSRDRLSPRRHPGPRRPSATSRRRPRTIPCRTARARSAPPASRCSWAARPCRATGRRGAG